MALLWSTKRRLIYGGSVVFFVILISSLIAWNFFYKAPSCSDGVQNGDEKGIDCGGSCKSICIDEALSPVVLWSKTFHISGDVYSAVAFVENPNINSENNKAEYRFKIYNDEGKLITTIEGVTSIPKNKKFTIFEPGIILKNQKPKTTEFEFVSYDTWQKNTTEESEISLEYSTLTSTSTTPSLNGKIINKSSQKIGKVELTVFILDNKENAIAAAKTFVENLDRGTTQDFFFTWPKPLNLGMESCSTPIDLVLALDRSGSMLSEGANPPEPFTTVINTAQNFVKNLAEDDKVGVVSFGTNSKIESSLTFDKENINNIINNLFLSTTTLEQTNITGGLGDAFSELNSSKTRINSKKVLVLLTDGVPTEPKNQDIQDYPSISAELKSTEIKNANIIIYTIGLGKKVSESFLKEISTDTNHYFFAPNKEMLASIYNKISSNLCEKKPNVITVIYRII